MKKYRITHMDKGFSCYEVDKLEDVFIPFDRMVLQTLIDIKEEFCVQMGKTCVEVIREGR